MRELLSRKTLRNGPMKDKINHQKFADGLPSLKGKCIAITGTTSGTGYCLAFLAAKKEAAAILLLNRKSERSAKMEAEIIRVAPPNTKIITVECDLSSFDAVKKAASVAKAKSEDFGGIDVLCCNAAIAQMPDQRTADGYDIQMQTNHLSHALLVEELEPSMEAAADARGEARIVFVTSGARFWPFVKEGPKDFGGAHFTKSAPDSLGGSCTTMQMMSLKAPCSIRYNHSKLANATYAMALHEKFAARGSKVKCLVAEPGASDTSLIKNCLYIRPGVKANPYIVGFMVGLTKMIGMAQSAADGSTPLAEACFGVDVQSGDLFAPTNSFGSCPFYVRGLPDKKIAGNAAMSGSKFAEDNVLSKDNQKAAWDATRREIGA